MSSESDPFGIKGKTIFITGAARGLGRAYATRLAKRGAIPVVQDLQFDSKETDQSKGFVPLPQALDEMGVDYLASEFDLTDSDATRRWIESAVDELGRADVLIANAGGGFGQLHKSAASTLSSSDYERAYRMNLLTAVNAVSAVSHVMTKQGEGKIILTSSQAGVRANIGGNYAHYAAAKAAIVSYMRNLAQDLGQYGITVNAIAPGYIASDRMLIKFQDSGLEEIEGRIALKRLGTPDECAAVVEFLSSDFSSYMSGSLLTIDGGSVRNGI